MASGDANRVESPLEGAPRTASEPQLAGEKAEGTKASSCLGQLISFTAGTESFVLEEKACVLRGYKQFLSEQ